MAENAVTLLAVLAENLLMLLKEEGKTLSGVHKDVEHIKNLVKNIKPFMKNAEEKVLIEESVKNWMNGLREVMFRMEDVVDLYLFKVAKRDGMRKKIKSIKHRHRISSEIKDIRQTLDDLFISISTRLQLLPSHGDTLPNTIPRAHFVKESQLVGIEQNMQKFRDWLAKANSPLLVVVGAAGIGKTSIVKNVYNKQTKLNQPKKKKDFDFCVWITMTQADSWYPIMQIKEKILMADPLGSSSLRSATRENLTEKLREYFIDKRCLIVLDDVKELKVWDVIQFAIPQHRVIITTQRDDFPNNIGGDTSVEKIKLEPLSLEDALKLFHQKVKHVQFPELSQLSKEFMEKCNGVPLAIVAISSLLSTVKSAIEWRRVRDDLGSLLRSHHHLETVRHVLLQSYQELPYRLKQCFLYFGHFPQGYSISCKRLIRLWIAEDFVEGDTQNKSMEELGGEYLAELICRGLVHASRVDFDGIPRSCHVYNLMHEIISSICKDQMFCHVMEDVSTPVNSNMDFIHRRLSIIKKNDSATMERDQKWGKVRSCFVFDDAKKWQVNNHFFSSFEFLIRLDLSDACLSVDVLPEQVGNLLNLKYLSLRNTNIMSLPESIGNLVNLQTLDLKQTKLHEVKIDKLVKLRHLLAYYVSDQSSEWYCLEGLRLSEGVQNLESLQNLSYLDVTGGRIIKGLQKLTKLRKLGIIKLEAKHCEALCNSIEHMINLCSLSIGALGKQDMLKLQSLNPPLSLKRLYLYGRLGELPSWISTLPNLIRLYLKWSDLKQDPLHYLKDLPQLLYLELYDAYKGERLDFGNGWLKLKVLYLGLLPNLKTIEIGKGKVPCLEILKIGRCHQMIRLPKDIQNLKHLEKLYLYDMHEQFIKRLCDERSEDYWIINKIPLVEYSNNDHFASFS
ncbi:disease resistance protein RPM1-like [Vigna umbellata]|uniref:disease resistance protein RPM1-like n=1 Tax=Vigna umbellata TaxID=87088 RepID=UPI001F5EE946|nr:disease resistance protein RPM1-like [Vigna umbellata]